MKTWCKPPLKRHLFCHWWLPGSVFICLCAPEHGSSTHIEPPLYFGGWHTVTSPDEWVVCTKCLRDWQILCSWEGIRELGHDVTMREKRRRVNMGEEDKRSKKIDDVILHENYMFMSIIWLINSLKSQTNYFFNPAETTLKTTFLKPDFRSHT